jgi:coenzyme PQQ precursor peptide PqqA
MKIMRHQSLRGGWRLQGIRESMAHGMHQVSRLFVHQLKETAMQWTTPTAQDFRFGFEITAYAAAR